MTTAELDRQLSDSELNANVHRLALASISKDVEHLYYAYLIGYLFTYVKTETFARACTSAVEYAKNFQKEPENGRNK